MWGQQVFREEPFLERFEALMTLEFRLVREDGLLVEPAKSGNAGREESENGFEIGRWDQLAQLIVVHKFVVLVQGVVVAFL